MQVTTANKLVQDLLGNFPPPNANGMNAIEFSNREAVRLKGLITVMTDHEEIDVRKAISDFIAGKVRNHNPAFCPTAPQLATHIREVRDKRLDSGRWDRIAAKNAELLPPPEKSEESRQRVREMMRQFTNEHTLKPKTATETPEQAQGWLNERQRRMIADGVETTAGDPLELKSDEIPVTPQLREILKRQLGR